MSSHPMDALGYGCLEIASDQVVQDKIGNNKHENMFNPVMRTF
jgi:hypothetical protein